ncbi:Fe-S cluster assembly scaffold SufA [Candidatus Fukatsuia anoeciicola]|uniref:Fe-S cluster assembly scaffold SufA n=1 Tax=Candidatus Fukatsuia anoeciicola TaxID=2994492 RepID=UPI0034647DA7
MQQSIVKEFLINDNNWLGIIITKNAAMQIVKLMQQNLHAKGLKLSVKSSGCADFTYVLDIVKSPANDDLLFEYQKAKLYVPLKAMPFIDGTKMDYVREGLNQIFKFDNPKAQHSCGCGESFSV